MCRRAWSSAPSTFVSSSEASRMTASCSPLRARSIRRASWIWVATSGCLATSSRSKESRKAAVAVSFSSRSKASSLTREALIHHEPLTAFMGSKSFRTASTLSRALAGSPRATLFWASVRRAGMGQTTSVTSVSFRVRVTSKPPSFLVRSTEPLTWLMMPFLGSTTALGGMELSILKGSLISQRSFLKTNVWAEAASATSVRAESRRKRMAIRVRGGRLWLVPLRGCP